MENLLKMTAMNDLDKAVAYIKDIVSAYYNLDSSVYENKNRKQELTKVKHIALYLCYENLNITRSKLGSFFGCNHTMVVYIAKKYKGYLEWDADLRKEIEDITLLVKFKVADSLNLNEMYYYVPLNEFTSIRYGKSKSIILQGFSQEEIDKIKIEGIDGVETERRSHSHQKFYILEKRNNEKDNNHT